MIDKRTVLPLLTAFVALVIPSRGTALSMPDRTAIYSPDIKTLAVYPEDNYYAPPVISLGSPSDRIVISFDELSPSRSYLRYRLVHCDAMWHPDGLLESEYVDGFNEAEIDSYDFSQGTATNYVHYSITVPNEDMHLILSGNYLLQVYPEHDPEKILLQAAFSVTDNSIDVMADVTSRTDFDYNGKHQQLTVTADCENMPGIHNPYNDLAIVISQNSRIDNEVVLRTPMSVAADKAIYEHQPQLVFPAGNEYRRIEFVSTTFPGMGIDHIEYADPFYHIVVGADQARSSRNYQYDQTQYGHYTVREYNSTYSDTEAEYVMVHFTLYMPQMPDSEIFLDGDFTQRRFDPESLMIYNPHTKAYEKSLLLKQGAYNYNYLAVPRGSTKGATAPVEGDYYQTSNEYLVKAYYRLPGDRYDRLGGVTAVYSGR